MNYMSAELQESEQKLNNLNAYALQSVYLVSSGKNLNEALINNEKAIRTVEDLKQKRVVGKYSGVSSLIISDSLQKTENTAVGGVLESGKEATGHAFPAGRRKGIEIQQYRLRRVQEDG